MKGLVLAGGEGRRYGSDKGLAIWSPETKETFIERALRVLGSQIKDVYLSRHPLQEPVLLSSDRVLYDAQVKRAGPSAGLLAAHAAWPEEAWFVMACDAIGANEDCIHYLLKTYTDSQSSSPVDAVVYTNAQSIEPLLGIWTPRALRALGDDPEAGPRRALMRVHTTSVAAPDERWLLNKNERDQSISLVTSE